MLIGCPPPGFRTKSLPDPIFYSRTNKYFDRMKRTVVADIYEHRRRLCFKRFFFLLERATVGINGIVEASV